MFFLNKLTDWSRQKDKGSNNLTVLLINALLRNPITFKNKIIRDENNNVLSFTPQDLWYIINYCNSQLCYYANPNYAFQKITPTVNFFDIPLYDKLYINILKNEKKFYYNSLLKRLNTMNKKKIEKTYLQNVHTVTKSKKYIKKSQSDDISNKLNILNEFIEPMFKDMISSVTALTRVFGGQRIVVPSYTIPYTIDKKFAEKGRYIVFYDMQQSLT